MPLAYQAAFDARSDLKDAYGDNALLLFALQVRQQIDDVHTVAATALTDNPNDKKCDLVYVDRERRYLIVAQGYVSRDLTRSEAPANKASDLNTAAGWLLGRELHEVPVPLRSAAEEVHAALHAGDISFVHFWYVHNLPESHNVRSELRTVEATVRNILASRFPSADVEEISAVEVGQATLEEWYQGLLTPILVTNAFDLSVSGGYTMDGQDWQAYVSAIPASWLHARFKEHGDKLFSANVRGYLGSRRSVANINHGIKHTASEDPSHFWVFNNGVTILVNDWQCDSKGTTVHLEGLSIVNGAQTTGAIGSLDAAPADRAMVQARFVKCNSRETIKQIIEYNNRQNEIEPADFRSNDPVQRRLRNEFSEIPDATYWGGRRGGGEDIIRRPGNLIPSDTAAQALVAFHQNPVTAYNRRSQIWASDELYTRYYSERTHAEHLIFAYSLLRSIEARKAALILDANDSSSQTQASRVQLEFLRQRGAIFVLTAAVAACLEVIANRAVSDPYRASFGIRTSPAVAQSLWSPIVQAVIPFYRKLLPAVTPGLNNPTEVNSAVDDFKSSVEALKEAGSSLPAFEEFARHVVISN